MKIILLVLSFWCCNLLSAQTTYTKKHITIPKRSTQKMQPFGDTISLYQQAPLPDGTSVKRKLQELKIQVREQSKTHKNKQGKQLQTTAAAPLILESFDVVGPYNQVLDTAYPIITSGQPLDNTLAVSNGGLLLTAINSKVYGYDLNADSALFNYSGTSGHTYSFAQFSNLHQGTGTSFPFDPKLLYDPLHDRFIFCFISGRDSSDSKIVMAFSSTNDPRDAWYLYDIPGNPRNGNEWSDYPALGLSTQNLFLTINIIIDGVSWQEGFNGSLIWQMNLDSAYLGADSINLTLWDSIQYQNKYIRNLNPVLDAMGPQHPEIYFISNRNFDLQNDTVFLLKLSESASSQDNPLSIDYGILDAPYGMPPNGQQADTDTNDPTSGLQTNDARWLGAIRIADTIQFVGNSVDFQTGRAGIYHGFIKDLQSTAPQYSGGVFSDPGVDYGYPNIAFTGKSTTDNQVIIGFDYTSATDFAGVAALYYRNGTYSEALRIRTGENYIDSPPLQNDPYERWGDYFGIQPVYNQMGSVWLAGVYALPTKRNSIHLAKLQSPDSIPTAAHTIQPHIRAGVFPNPSLSDFILRFESAVSGTVHIQVIDAQGKIAIHKKEIALQSGFHDLVLNGAYFSPGIYTINVFNNKQVLFTKKIIKQ